MSDHRTDHILILFLMDFIINPPLCVQFWLPLSVLTDEIIFSSQDARQGLAGGWWPPAVNCTPDIIESESPHNYSLPAFSCQYDV